MCVPIVYMQWNIMGVEVRSLKCHIIDSDGNHHFPECWKIRSLLKNEFVAANALSGMIGTTQKQVMSSATVSICSKSCQFGGCASVNGSDKLNRHVSETC